MKHSHSKKIITLIGALTLLSGCAPALIGGATLVGGAMTKEKGIIGTVEDSKISTQIKLGLYRKDPDLHARVNVTVQNGEVMLTGAVLTAEDHLDAVRIAWEVKGVERVIDNIAVSKEVNVAEYAKDTWITTQLKSRMLLHSDIYSLNYSIKTVGGTVYLMGIAHHEEELDKAVSLARAIDGVKKVVSYVKIRS